MLPIHTDGFGPKVIVGSGLIVTVITCAALTHPVVPFVTIKLAVYVPANAAPGIVIEIGLAGKAALTTSTKPCASAAPLKSILN